jgi:16S rRNA processing protein RimM
VPDDELIAVGRIGKPRGVRGETYVEPWTDDPDERFAVGSVLTTDPVEAGPLTVASAGQAGGRLVVRFDTVDGREAAEALRGVRLVVPASARPPLTDPDDFYDTDLIGLDVRATDGVSIGAVSDVLHAGGGDYLVLVHAGREHLVPFVAAMVPTVDLAGGFVVIDPPDGLFDL